MCVDVLFSHKGLLSTGVSLVETDEPWLEEDRQEVQFEVGRKCPVCVEKGIPAATFSRPDVWHRHWRENHERTVMLLRCPEAACDYRSKRPFDVKTHILHRHGKGTQRVLLSRSMQTLPMPGRKHQTLYLCAQEGILSLKLRAPGGRPDPSSPMGRDQRCVRIVYR